MPDIDPDYVMSPDPEHEAELHINAWDGLTAADLAPLAALLRSEFEIEETLREAIADAIEGKSPVCQIAAKRKRRGNPGPDEKGQRLDAEIAAFVRKLMTEPGSFEGAIEEAVQHFKRSRSTIIASMQRNKKWREALIKKRKTS
jgi:hypothetical protein